MDKLKMQSENLVSENIDKLAMLFPNCVTEGKNEQGEIVRVVDFDLLRQELSKDIVEGTDERYTLNWAGKKQSILTANSPIAKTLRPCKEESVNFDSTQNLYIEGDNLDVLKLLRETYLNKVKMIYIDPPYNTGNDFVYEDDFASSADEYLENSKSFDEQGNRLFQNNDSNGRFHSDWLSMMFSRLKLAKDLLTDDGVIFISIDDNEQANLKKICDEVFGAGNFVATYVKQSKVGGGSDTKFVVKEHEYCMVYSKNIVACGEMFIAHDAEYLKRYKESDNIGRYFWDTLARPGLKNPIYYDIIAPDGTIINNGWIHSKQRFEEEYKDGTVRIIKKTNGEWSVQFKQYLNIDGRKPRSMTMDFGGSVEGKNDIRLLFDNEKIFSYPKSTRLVAALASTIDGNDYIVLDFFSGSATTAHAVMQLNAEDGGNRKFIMVQLPEKTDEASEAYKAGYKNICEIGKERIRRAGKRILEQNSQLKTENAALKINDKKQNSMFDNMEQSDNNNCPLSTVNCQLDTGFRVLKLDTTCMKDVYYAPLDIDQGFLSSLESNIKEDRTSEDLLFQVMLDMGVVLSSNIEERKLKMENGELKIVNTEEYNKIRNCQISTVNCQLFTIYIVNDNNLICCFDANLTDEVVTQIAKLKPLYSVFRDSSMSSDSTAVNFDQIFATYSPATTRRVI